MYPFRTTTKRDAHTYVEDRGFPYEVTSDHPDFAVLDAQFGEMLKIGQTAQRNMEGKWEILDASPMVKRLSQEELIRAKKERASTVRDITVEIDGMVFDGDEIAQNRMSRVIAASANDKETTIWVMHDNSVETVTVKQLKQALRAAGQAQTAVWAKPYDVR